MTHLSPVLQHPEHRASAKAGHAGDQDGPLVRRGPVLGGPVLGGLVRVLPGEQVALVRENVISVV